MQEMHWFRWHHGATSDPKFRVVAKRCGQPVHVVIATWACILEHASAADERGSIASFDAEEVAVTLDLETETVVTCVTAMQGKVLDGDAVRSWERRQGGTKAAPAGSTERVRRYRERKRAAGANQEDKGKTDTYTNVTPDDETRYRADETPCNAMERNVTHVTPPREEERREEEIREGCKQQQESHNTACAREAASGAAAAGAPAPGDVPLEAPKSPKSWLGRPADADRATPDPAETKQAVALIKAALEGARRWGVPDSHPPRRG